MYTKLTWESFWDDKPNIICVSSSAWPSLDMRFLPQGQESNFPKIANFFQSSHKTRSTPKISRTRIHNFTTGAGSRLCPMRFYYLLDKCWNCIFTVLKFKTIAFLQVNLFFVLRKKKTLLKTVNINFLLTCVMCIVPIFNQPLEFSFRLCLFFSIFRIWLRFTKTLGTSHGK